MFCIRQGSQGNYSHIAAFCKTVHELLKTLPIHIMLRLAFFVSDNVVKASTSTVAVACKTVCVSFKKIMLIHIMLRLACFVSDKVVKATTATSLPLAKLCVSYQTTLPMLKNT